MASPVTRTKPMSGITFVVKLACFTGLHWMSVRDTVPLACIQHPVISRICRRTGMLTLSLLWLTVNKCMRYEETPDFDQV